MNETAPVEADDPGDPPGAVTELGKSPRVEQLERLQPAERRYDVPIEDDFVFSVHPNGIKTWVFVYEHNERLRRRTLGVFPDMPPKAARRALRSVRALRHTFDDAPAPRPLPSGARPGRGGLVDALLSPLGAAALGLVAIVTGIVLVLALSGQTGSVGS